jgi:hypothetical protein
VTSSQPHRRHLALALLAAFLLALMAAGPAKVGAAESSPFLKAIRVNSVTEDGLGPLLTKFKTLRCGLYGKGSDKRFFAFANTESPKYRLTVFVDAWRGFKPTYDLHYSSDDPLVRLFAPGDQTYSNEYSLPGPAYAGLIDFKRGGDKISIGFIPAINQDATTQVSIIGHATCAWRTPRK